MSRRKISWVAKIISNCLQCRFKCLDINLALIHAATNWDKEHFFYNNKDLLILLVIYCIYLFSISNTSSIFAKVCINTLINDFTNTYNDEGIYFLLIQLNFNRHMTKTAPNLSWADLLGCCVRTQRKFEEISHNLHLKPESKWLSVDLLLQAYVHPEELQMFRAHLNSDSSNLMRESDDSFLKKMYICFRLFGHYFREWMNKPGIHFLIFLELNSIFSQNVTNPLSTDLVSIRGYLFSFISSILQMNMCFPTYITYSFLGKDFWPLCPFLWTEAL